jgi:hypothetical protein
MIIILFDKEKELNLNFIFQIFYIFFHLFIYANINFINYNNTIIIVIFIIST